MLVLSTALILAPLALRRDPRQADQNPAVPRGRVLAYFGLLGIAFLFVEIPLIQRWILLLGHATYAFAAVVLSLLLFSGLGSLLTRAAWLPRRAAWVAAGPDGAAYPLLVVRLADAALGWPLWARAAVAVIGLAPLGVLMGLPFPPRGGVARGSRPVTDLVGMGGERGGLGDGLGAGSHPGTEQRLYRGAAVGCRLLRRSGYRAFQE